MSERPPAVIPCNAALPYPEPPPLLPPPLPYDFGADLDRSLNLEEARRRALASGNLEQAQLISAELEQIERRMSEDADQQTKAPSPPGPLPAGKGEVRKLVTRLEALAHQAEGLEARKKKVMLAESKAAIPDLSRAVALNHEIGELEHEAAEMRARLEEIDQHNIRRNHERQHAKLLRDADKAEALRRKKLWNCVRPSHWSCRCSRTSRAWRKSPETSTRSSGCRQCCRWEAEHESTSERAEMASTRRQKIRRPASARCPEAASERHLFGKGWVRFHHRQGSARRILGVQFPDEAPATLRRADKERATRTAARVPAKAGNILSQRRRENS